jgi:hypothetical protein
MERAWELHLDRRERMRIALAEHDRADHDAVAPKG